MHLALGLGSDILSILNWGHRIDHSWLLFLILKWCLINMVSINFFNCLNFIDFEHEQFDPWWTQMRHDGGTRRSWRTSRRRSSPTTTRDPCLKGVLGFLADNFGTPFITMLKDPEFQDSAWEELVTIMKDPATQQAHRLAIFSTLGTHTKKEYKLLVRTLHTHTLHSENCDFLLSTLGTPLLGNQYEVLFVLVIGAHLQYNSIPKILESRILAVKDSSLMNVIEDQIRPIRVNKLLWHSGQHLPDE